MNRKRAASALSALLYAQALLGIAGLGTVLLKHVGGDAPVVRVAAAPTETALR